MSEKIYVEEEEVRENPVKIFLQCKKMDKEFKYFYPYLLCMFDVNFIKYILFIYTLFPICMADCIYSLQKWQREKRCYTFGILYESK